MGVIVNIWGQDYLQHKRIEQLVCFWTSLELDIPMSLPSATTLQLFLSRLTISPLASFRGLEMEVFDDNLSAKNENIKN